LINEQQLAMGAAIAAGGAYHASTLGKPVLHVMRQHVGGIAQELQASAGMSGNVQFAIESLNLMASEAALYAALSLLDQRQHSTTSLRPGEVYTIQVLTQGVATGGKPITANRRISYRLVFVGRDSDEAVTLLPVQSLTLTATEITQARSAAHVAKLTLLVPAAPPQLALRLVLYASAGLALENGALLDLGEQEVASLSLSLDGVAAPVPLPPAAAIELLDPRDAPDDVVYMVVRRSAQQLEITPFCKGPQLADTVHLVLNPLASYQAIDQPDFTDTIEDLSESGLMKLWQWLGQLRAIGVDPRVYALIEYGVGELPWELLDYRGRHLGRSARMARWAELIDYEAPRMLCVRDEERSGGVLALLPPRHPMPASLADVQLTRAADVADLWRQLFAAPGQYALVYVSDVDAARSAELVKLLRHNPTGSHLAGQRPLFFVDGPGSAHDAGGLFQTRSLAHTLLLRVADGLLGIVTPQLPAGSGSLSEPILAALVAGLGPAEALRQLRESMHTRRGADPRAFLTSFLYVYYGNPLLRLALALAALPGGR